MHLSCLCTPWLIEFAHLTVAIHIRRRNTTNIVLAYPCPRRKGEKNVALAAIVFGCVTAAREKVRIMTNKRFMSESSCSLLFARLRRPKTGTASSNTDASVSHLLWKKNSARHFNENEEINKRNAMHSCELFHGEMFSMLNSSFWLLRRRLPRRQPCAQIFPFPQANVLVAGLWIPLEQTAFRPTSVPLERLLAVRHRDFFVFILIPTVGAETVGVTVPP